MNKYTYNFQNFRTISTFAGADNDQSELLVEILNFRKQVKLKNPQKKQQKEDDLKNLYKSF